MKSRKIQAAVTAALLLGSVIVFSGNAALAQQTLNLKATIPFAFYAGEKLMPAGDYRVEPVAQGIIRLTNADSSASVFFFVLRAPESKDSTPRIVFKAYSDEKYLSELWWGQDGSISVPSPRERELALTYSRVRVPLSAAGR